MKLDELPGAHANGSASVGADDAVPSRERTPGRPYSAIGPWAALAFAVLMWSLDVGEFFDAVIGVDLDLFNLLVGLMIPLFFVVTVACLYEAAPPARRLWTLLGLVFASMWAAVSTSAYFLQLTVVRFAEEQGRVADVPLISFGEFDRTSAAWSMNVLGWGVFLALAVLLVSPALVGGGRRRLGRWALRLSGISMLLLAMGFVVGSEAIQLMGAGFGWFVGLPLSGLALASILRSTPHEGPLTP